MSTRLATLMRYATTGVFVFFLVIIALDRTGFIPALRTLVTPIYEIALLLGAVAVVLGAVSVAWSHLHRVQAGAAGWGYSLILLVTLVIVFAAGLLDVRGAASPLLEWFFDSIIAPGQATLFALLVFFMTAAAFHLARIGRRGGAWLLAGMVVTLLAQTPALQSWLPVGYASFAGWLVDGPVMAALRGVLVAAALGAVVVIVRMALGRS